MKENTPTLSVVLPTYNRGHLLPWAIQSVLGQTYRDFSLIISDGGSTDDTPEVVGQFNDARIHYIRSKSRLSINENYLQGVQHADSPFVTFIADDDALVPTAFEQVMNVIRSEGAKVVAFDLRFYNPDTYFYGEAFLPANTLLTKPYTTDLNVFSREEALQSLFSHYKLISGTPDPRFILPFVGNAVYSVDIFNALFERTPNPFETTPADMYLSCGALHLIDKFYCLDTPLLVCAQWAENVTASQNTKKGDELRKHYERMLNGRELEHTPLKFALPWNCYVNALLTAKSDFDPEGALRVDWTVYFNFMQEYLLSLHKAGVSVGNEIVELRATADKYKIALNAPSRLNSNLRTRAKTLLKRIPYLRAAYNRIINRDLSEYLPEHISGNEVGFSNIVDAARYLSDDVAHVSNRDVSAKK